MKESSYVGLKETLVSRITLSFLETDGALVFDAAITPHRSEVACQMFAAVGVPLVVLLLIDAPWQLILGIVVGVLVLAFWNANRVEHSVMEVDRDDITVRGPEVEGWSRTIPIAHLKWIEFREGVSGAETEPVPRGLWGISFYGPVFLFPVDDEPQGLEVVERIVSRFPAVPRQPSYPGELSGHMTTLGL